SLEFDNGSEMQDPNTLLEGNGKYRRHLKINKLDDITGKKVSYYIKQSFKV
ncbi:DUF1801 domain-containing protein, partial [archaeon]|nr:DUF1801 domain-containing protein [archaeon]